MKSEFRYIYRYVLLKASPKMMKFISDEENKIKFVMACEDNLFAAVVHNPLSVTEGSLNFFLYNSELNLIMLISGMYMATLTVFY